MLQHIAGQGVPASCSGRSSMQQPSDSLVSEDLLLSEAEVRGFVHMQHQPKSRLCGASSPTAVTPPQILLESGPEWALLVLSRGNPIGRAAAAVVTNTWFERFILALVSWQGSSCCCLPPDGRCHMAAPTRHGVVSDNPDACLHCTTAVDPCKLRHPCTVRSQGSMGRSWGKHWFMQTGSLRPTSLWRCS